MESNKIVREQIFEIIKNQIKDNNPPETKKTYDKLINLGYNDFQTNQLIGQCIAIEIFDALKYEKPFDEIRFIKNLKTLPEEP